MSYEIEYRKAGTDKHDIELAVEMMQKLGIYQKMDDVSMMNEENMKKLLAENAGRGVFAYIDGRPAAFLYYYYNYPMFIGDKCIYIDCLYIEEEFRNKGIGTQILKYITKKALNEGCRRIEWLCLTWNEPALCLYDKIGAKKIDTVSLHRMFYDDMLNLLK